MRRLTDPLDRLRAAAVIYAGSRPLNEGSAKRYANELAKAAIEYAVAVAKRELAKLPPRLSDKLVTLIIDAVKTTGEWAPDRTMTFFEEYLTGEEYDDVRGFLTWISESPKARTCGWGNIQQRYAEYRAATEKAGTKEVLQ